MSYNYSQSNRVGGEPTVYSVQQPPPPPYPVGTTQYVPTTESRNRVSCDQAAKIVKSYYSSVIGLLQNNTCYMRVCFGRTDRTNIKLKLFSEMRYDPNCGRRCHCNPGNSWWNCLLDISCSCRYILSVHYRCKFLKCLTFSVATWIEFQTLVYILFDDKATLAATLCSSI